MLCLRNVAPPDPVPVSGRGGQACDIAPYWVVSKWFIAPQALES
jgi:hypothetical protein